MGKKKDDNFPRNSISAIYDYVDENGLLLFQQLRYNPKYFRERRPDGNGGWIWSLDNDHLVLYRLPQVLSATVVLLLEGEKDVETVYRLGLPSGFAASSSPFGAGQWRSQYSECLRGKQIIICPDNDIPGKQHMKQIITDLMGKAGAIRIISLPESVKDISEWVESGGTPDKFTVLINNADPVSETL